MSFVDSHYQLRRPERFLIGTSGSIAATQLPAYLDALRATFGGSYSVVLTRTAEHFIPAAAVRLHADRVIHGERPEDWPTDRPSRLTMDHDALIALPSTAHLISCVAAGAAPNRLSTAILSAAYPTIFFPHMGEHMWSSAAVRRNVETLRGDGHIVVDPELRESRDVETGDPVPHPAVPSPARVVEVLEELFDGSAGSSGSGG